MHVEHVQIQTHTHANTHTYIVKLLSTPSQKSQWHSENSYKNIYPNTYSQKYVKVKGKGKVVPMLFN